MRGMRGSERDRLGRSGNGTGHGGWIAASLGLVTLAWGVASYRLRNAYPFLDEGGYLECARLLTDGQLPYLHYHETHMPGIILSTAAFFWLLGTSLETARFEMFCVNTALLFSTYGLARKFCAPAAALAAVVLLALCTLAGPFRGFTLLNEPFVALLAVACAWLLLCYRERERRIWLVASGFGFGLALLFKQTYVFLLPGVAVVLWALASERGWARRRTTLDVSVWTVAASLPGLTLFGSTAVMGCCHALVGDTALFFLSSRAVTIFQWIDPGLHPVRYFTPLAAAGVALALDRRRSRLETIFLGVFAAAGCMVAFPRFEFFHVVPALPFVAILVASLPGALADRLGDGTRWDRGVASSVAPCVVVVAVALPLMFGDPMFGRTFDAQRSIAEYVRQRTAEDEPVLVFPAMPAISFFSERPLATRSVTSAHLYLAPQDTRIATQQALIAEIEQSRPPYVVYLEDTNFDGQVVEDWGGLVVEHLNTHYTEEHRYPDVFDGFCGDAAILRRIP